MLPKPSLPFYRGCPTCTCNLRLIITAKLQRKKLIVWGIGAAVLLLALILGIGWLGAGPAASTIAAMTGQNGGDNQSRVAYLESFGWTVKEEPLSIEELSVPQQWNDSYTQYLELQKSQGFDLEPYKGKRIRRYTYEITNYPTGETGVQAGLLVYRNTIIGGDVLSSQLDGFIHGLNRPA